MYKDKGVISIDAGNPVTVTLQLQEQFKDYPREIHSILRCAKIEAHKDYYDFILSNQPWEQ